MLTAAPAAVSAANAPRIAAPSRVALRVVPSWFTGRVDKTARSLAGDVTHTFFLLAVYVCGDAISTAFGGAITGAGRQCHSAAVVLVCYFVVALPLAYVVGVRWHFGFMGIISMMVSWMKTRGLRRRTCCRCHRCWCYRCCRRCCRCKMLGHHFHRFFKVLGTWAQAGGNALIVLRTDFHKESVAATDRVQWRAVSSKDGDGGDSRGGELELGAVKM